MDCQSESGLGILKTPKYEFKTRLFCYPTGDAGCFLVHVLYKVYFCICIIHIENIFIKSFGVNK